MEGFASFGKCHVRVVNSTRSKLSDPVMVAVPMSVHAAPLGRPSAITCVTRRQVLRRPVASHGHHASDSGGITPPPAGEQFVTVSSVLQQVPP